jgi:hypothetical protein
MGLRVSYKKKILNKFFLASLKSLKKGVGDGSGCARRIRIRIKMPDPHQNVTDHQQLAKTKGSKGTYTVRIPLS